jgi:hypothetical protein
MEKTEKDKIATKQRTEFLKCELTTEEVASAANDLAKLLDDKQAIEAGLASVKADFKAKLEKCDADIKVKQRLVRDKSEYRNIECDVEYNYSTTTVKIIRKDTKETVEERSMDYSEKQMELPFDDEKDEAA